MPNAKRGVPDEENPEWTREEILTAPLGHEILPAPAVAALKRSRGKQKAPTKRMVSLRMDPDVLAAYRATGKGWQSRMHDTLATNAPRPARRRRSSPRQSANATKRSRA